MKKKMGRPKALQIQKLIQFSKLKDRHGNREGPCQRAEAIADYLLLEHWCPAPAPPTKNRCKLISQWPGDEHRRSQQRSHRCHQKMKQGKAPGHDKVNIDTIKALDAENCIFLTLAFNGWWTSESVPTDHLKALVVSMFNKGNTQDVANYRPISLLNSTYKIFTSILQTQIAITQYGFGSSRSTQQPVFIARNPRHRGGKWWRVIITQHSWTGSKRLIK